MTGVADASLSNEVSKIIKQHSLYGAICMVLPLWGLETLIYIPVLWGMYVKLCDKAKVPFWSNFVTSILGGFIVNVIVVIILNFILDFIPLAGWIASALIGYCATLFSGCAYLETLAALHERGRVKERFNTDKAMNYIKNMDKSKEESKEVMKS